MPRKPPSPPSVLSELSVEAASSAELLALVEGPPVDVDVDAGPAVLASSPSAGRRSLQPTRASRSAEIRTICVTTPRLAGRSPDRGLDSDFRNLAAAGRRRSARRRLRSALRACSLRRPNTHRVSFGSASSHRTTCRCPRSRKSRHHSVRSRKPSGRRTLLARRAQDRRSAGTSRPRRQRSLDQRRKRTRIGTRILRGCSVRWARRRSPDLVCTAGPARPPNKSHGAERRNSPAPTCRWRLRSARSPKGP